MKDKGLLIGIGLGVAYLYFKSQPAVAGTVYPAGFVGPTPPGSIVASPAGSLVGWLSSLIHGGSLSPNNYNSGLVPLATGGATDVTDINQIGPQPAPANVTDISQGCVSNGNVCDPNDCDWNQAVCNEMQGVGNPYPG